MRQLAPIFRPCTALLLSAVLVPLSCWAATPPGCPPGNAARPLILQLHWYPQAQFAGYMMAAEKGFFEKAGVAIRLRWAEAGEQAFQRLAASETDFCTGWLSDAIRERDAGKPLVNIAQVVERSSTMLVTRSDSDIKTPSDMTGKRVGVWGGNNDVQIMAFFHRTRVRPIVVPQSASIVPFLRGAVDVASAMHYNEYHKLIEAGLSPDQLRVFSLADYGLAFPEDGIYCTATTRRDRPEACAAVVKACQQGWQYAFNHEAETLDVVMKHCREMQVHTNRNHQRWMLRSIGDAIRGGADGQAVAWGSLSGDVYGRVAKTLLDEGLIRSVPPFKQLYQPLGM